MVRPIGKSFGGTFGALDENQLLNPELSPDGLRVAVDRTVQNNTDVWIMDASRMTRFTFDPGTDHWPVWSPDGGRIVLDSGRTGTHNLFQKPFTTSAAEEQLLRSPLGQGVSDWSPDGRFILYGIVDPKNGWDLWLLPTAPGAQPQPFLATPFEERNGQFSPDGRFVAYESNEAGRGEIYVRPFPGPGGQWQISTAGGVQARWRHDGRELYYIAPDGKLMAVSITVKGSGAAATIEPGAPQPLFPSHISGYSIARQQYAVARDGRFLINVTTDDAGSPITLLLNWQPRSK